MKQEKKYFDLLQVFRGIASLLVVIHHTYASFAHYHNLDNKIGHFIAGVGKLGVDFFFVLSGFIIAYTTYQFRDQTSYLKKYAFNRVIRIYIPYWPVGIAMLLLYHIFPSMSNSDRSVSWITSLLLVPHGNPALSVAWTLVFEMFFYIIYSLNFFSRKWWYIALAVWITGIVGRAVSGITFDNAFLNLIFNLYNLEFILGVFTAYLVRSQVVTKANYWSFIIPTGIFMVFLVMKYTSFNLFPFSQNLIFALAAAGLVWVGAVAFTKKINEKNIWMMLGNSSYSLYLLHNPLQSFLVRLVPSVNVQILIMLQFLAVVFLCCVISYVYYLIFEKHLMNFVKKKFQNV